jgi:flagellin-specific chaperone FliS
MNPYQGRAAAAYRQAATSVHPTVAVVKLYDETLLAIHQAIRAKAAGDHELAFNKVLRAATILRGLQHSLDFNKGGAVAERLFRVYKSYILSLHLNFGKKDVLSRYGRLMEGLVELRDAWASIVGLKPYGQIPQLDPEQREAFVKAASASEDLRTEREKEEARQAGRAERLRRRAAEMRDKDAAAPTRSRHRSAAAPEPVPVPPASERRRRLIAPRPGTPAGRTAP